MSTKRVCRFAASRYASTEPSTSKPGRLTSCCAVSPLPKPSFGRPWRRTKGHGARTVTLDGHVPSRRTLWLLRREALFRRHVKIRTNRYLNIIIERDRRAIKRRCSAMHGLNSMPAATVTIGGIEPAHRI